MLQPHEHAYRRAEKVAVAGHCDRQAQWGDRLPEKPKWMRWPTDLLTFAAGVYPPQPRTPLARYLQRCG